MPPTPGPGQHEIPQKVCREGPKYSINGRGQELVHAIPGPGAYDPDNSKVLFSASKFSVPANNRVMTKPLDVNPGPGTHEAKSSFGIGPKFSI